MPTRIFSCRAGIPLSDRRAIPPSAGTSPATTGTIPTQTGLSPGTVGATPARDGIIPTRQKPSKITQRRLLVMKPGFQPKSGGRK